MPSFDPGVEHVDPLDGHESFRLGTRFETNLPGARLVKAFNHLAAATLAADPAGGGGRRVIFVSSDDEAAAAPVRTLAEQLGFAPVWLGKLAEGGALVQARDKSWAPLIFQDLFKKDQ